MRNLWRKPQYFNKFTILLDRGGSGSYQSVKRISDSNMEEESMADGRDKEMIGTQTADAQLKQAGGAETVEDEALEAVNGGLRIQGANMSGLADGKTPNNPGGGQSR